MTTAHLLVMLPQTYQIPLEDVLAQGSHSLTRSSLIDLAKRVAMDGRGVLHVVLSASTGCSDENEGDFEVARVELGRSQDGSWALQFVQHPARCRGVTANIKPSSSDFAAYLQFRAQLGLPRPLGVYSAQELEEEGLGPCASLNLRPLSFAPAVPTRADLQELETLIDLRAHP